MTSRKAVTALSYRSIEERRNLCSSCSRLLLAFSGAHADLCRRSTATCASSEVLTVSSAFASALYRLTLDDAESSLLRRSSARCSACTSISSFALASPLSPLISSRSNSNPPPSPPLAPPPPPEGGDLDEAMALGVPPTHEGDTNGAGEMITRARSELDAVGLARCAASPPPRRVRCDSRGGVAARGLATAARGTLLTEVTLCFAIWGRETTAAAAGGRLSGGDADGGLAAGP